MISQPDMSSRLASDTKGLDQLKQSAKQNAPQSVKAVAQQFESMFMNMVMKSMREASGGEGGLLDNQQSKMFTSMLDQQLSQNMAKKGVGLAEVLIRQLSPAAAVATGEEAAKANTSDKALRGNLTMNNEGVAGVSKLAVNQVNQLNHLNKGSTAGLVASLGKDVGGLNPAVRSDFASSLEIGAGIGGEIPNSMPFESIDDFASLLKASANGTAATSLPQAASGGDIKNVKPFSLAEVTAGGVNKVSTRQARASEGVALTATRNQPAHVKHFQTKLAAQAEEASRTTGIPAKFLLGQAALESGWGKREIIGADGKASHNLFGIKATPGWKGKVVEAVTTEYVNGVPQARREKFRAYDSYAEAFRDYGRLLSKNPRYENVIANAQDAGSFARGLQKAGYATDPNYAAKLTRIINNSLS